MAYTKEGCGQYLVSIRDWRVEVDTSVLTVKGVSDVAEERILVVEPPHILGLGVAPGKQAKHQWLVIVPSKRFVSLGELIRR